jgi:electron transfer flavoprotein beta subunit
MRGIRAVASVPIPAYSAAELKLDPATVGDAAAKLKRLDYFIPVLGKGAEMLHGSREEIVTRVTDLIAAKGGLR